MAERHLCSLEGATLTAQYDETTGEVQALIVSGGNMHVTVDSFSRVASPGTYPLNAGQRNRIKKILRTIVNAGGQDREVWSLPTYQCRTGG